jgi:bacillithiol biosynthesis cysteine-adding enzyme BshC
VSSQSEAAVVAGIVREAIPFARFPWIRPLVHAYSHDFQSVASMFAGNPADPEAWRETILRVGRRQRDRAGLSAVLKAQLVRREAPRPALEAAARLGRPDAMAVVTGQQAGVFGGPLYTLLKAVTTIQVARQASQTHGVDVVPVFWVDAEDHDWDEVCTAHLLDRESAPTSVTLPPVPGCGTHPVAMLTLDEGVGDALESLGQLLPPTEFTADLLASLRRAYRPGTSVSGAFATWLEALLGDQGLVVFESDDAAAKPLVADLFVEELTHPGRTARLAREGGAALAALGHSAQIEPADDLVSLFHVRDSGRETIQHRAGAFAIGHDVREGADLRAEAAASPERFSPNVLLRPIVQDCLFPTVCYIGGPSELAYHAQLGRVYEAFQVERPLILSRASATLLDSAALRFLDKHALPFESLQARDESALNRLLEGLLPPSVESRFTEAEQQTVQSVARLKEAVVGVDPTLGGVVDTTVERIQDTLRTLHNKIIQATKKKDDTLRRQFIRTRNLAFPEGTPQERLLGVAFFINRYGPGLPVRLLEGLPVAADAHYLVTP